ncbi:MAG: DDE-type integrase/transposase/recombinase [Brevundimonas sp.]|nr:DDE-type integrase/transposase/recombinase [Brevundimonas sp.]
MRSFTHWRWHLDEVFVRINGKRHYVWRAVDQEGETLESFVAKTRDRASAPKFLKKPCVAMVYPRRSSPIDRDPKGCFEGDR